MVTLHEVITFVVSMQISISSLQTYSVTLRDARRISLQSQTGNMSDAGSLNLNAVNGVTLNDSLTTGGVLTVNSDTNSDGTGLFTETGRATSRERPDAPHASAPDRTTPEHTAGPHPTP